MAKPIPFTTTSSKQILDSSARINEENFAHHEQCSVAIDLNSSSEDITRAAVRAARSVENLPISEECANGSCEPVYIPVIINFYEQDSQLTIEDTGLGAGGTPIDFQEQELSFKYNNVRRIFDKLNELFSEEVLYLDDLSDRQMSGIKVGGTSVDDCAHPNAYLRSSHQLSGGSGQWGKTLYVPTNSFGYKTGAQVLDEETNEFIDEYVKITLGSAYPNIRFFFPKRIKVSSIIDGIFLERTGCKVNSKEVVQYLTGSNDINNVSKNYLDYYNNEEFLYFLEDYPGCLIWDGDAMDSTFFSKLNVLQKIINGNDKELNISIKRIGSNFGTVYGEDYVNFYNFTGIINTIFSTFSYSYTGSRLNNQSMSDANQGVGTTPYTNGPNSQSGGTLYHEFIHSMGGGHSWADLTLAGVGVDPKSSTLGDGYFYNTSRIGENITHVRGNGDYVRDFILTKDIPPLLNAHLKPPFLVEGVENPKYKLLKRDSEKADADYEYWSNLPLASTLSQRSIPTNAGYTTEEINASYLERKTLLNNKYTSASEFLNYDFSIIQGDEKGYIEFLINRLLPFMTSNFTRKATFHEGSINTAAYISINKKLEFDNSRASDNRVLATLITGVHSFWGGSYILKNPPAFGSVFDGAVVFGGGSVRKPINQRYAYLVKVVASSATWDEAQAIEEQDGFFLPDSELLSSLVSNGSDNGTNIGNDPGEEENFHTNLFGDFSNSSNGTVQTWSSSEVAALTAYFVSISRDPRVSDSRITTLKSETLAVVHVKYIDLLEYDTVATQLVVNPTNDDGTRKGPDVTTYIPFCVRPDGTISSNNDLATLSNNTKVDPFFAHNYNMFNPAFPVYPDNTPIDDLLNEEFCPCLHITQTYYDLSATPYEYKLLGSNVNTWAFQHIFLKNECDSAINNFHSYGPNSRLHSGPSGEDIGSTVNNAYKELYADNDGYSDEAADSMVSLWAHSLERYYNLNDLSYSVRFYKYSDANETVLNLPVIFGYCGFGYQTVLPNAYQLDLYNYWVTHQVYAGGLEDEAIAAQDLLQDLSLFIYKQPAATSHYRGLRYCSHHVNIGLASTNAVYTNRDNIESRYDVGSSDINSSIYNPFKIYYEEVIGYNSYNEPEPGEYLHTLQFPNTAPLDYYSDIYGEFSPLNLNDIMYYSGNGIINYNNVLPEPFIKKINTYYNNPNTNIYQEYKDMYSYEDLPTPHTGWSSNVNWSGSLQDYIDRFVDIVKNSSVEGELGGCTDNTKYNYNPDATYNNGTCIDFIPGCTQDWADNYNPEANIDNGDCIATLCADSTATGIYGFGYNSDLLQTVAAYSEQYTTQALIEANEQLVGNLSSVIGDNSICSFTVQPRKPIIRLVCMNTSDTFSSNAAVSSLGICNSNPMITYIRDIDSQSIKTHTLNPEVVTSPLEDILVLTTAPDHTQVRLLNVRGNGSFLDIPLGGNATETFPSSVDGESIAVNATDDLLRALSLATDINTSVSNYYTLRNNFLYNCIENPILSDGSGGCYLFSYTATNYDLNTRLQNCIIPPAETNTEFGCENSIISQEGYISDYDYILNFDVVQSSPCSGVEPSPKYIIGAELASAFGNIAEKNGIIVSRDDIPYYSLSQLGELSGYPEELLLQRVSSKDTLVGIPSARQGSKSIGRSISNNYAITSPAFNMPGYGFLFNLDGTPYKGYFIVEQLIVEGEDADKVYYAYNNATSTKLDKIFYTRNELRGLVPESPQELLAKKIYKVINKIIKLTIFTDN